MDKPAFLIEYDTAKLQRRAKNDGYFTKLNRLYSPIPAVICGSCGNVCCRACPDFYLLEYLNVWRFIRYELKDESIESEIVARSVRWAFLSFFDPDVYCPFLFDGRCVIYEARPMNCRVWALEDENYYAKKSARAAGNAEKQQEFFAARGLETWKPIREFILPKCGEIQVEGGGAPLDEKTIVDLDNSVGFLHRGLIAPEDMRRINFLTHFPGHILLKKIGPERYDRTRIAVLKEYKENGTENLLNEIISSFEGKLP